MKSEQNQGKISAYTGWTRAARRILLTAIGFAVIAQLIVLLPPLGVIAQEGPRILRGGWYPWDPYQYLVVKQDVERLTGLDVQLVRAVFAQMGYGVSYDEVSWRQHQLDVKNGARDIPVSWRNAATRACLDSYRVCATRTATDAIARSPHIIRSTLVCQLIGPCLHPLALPTATTHTVPV